MNYKPDIKSTILTMLSVLFFIRFFFINNAISFFRSGNNFTSSLALVNFFN